MTPEQRKTVAKIYANEAHVSGIQKYAELGKLIEQGDDAEFKRQTQSWLSYNQSEAVNARKYIKAARKDHDRSLEALRDVFRKNATHSGEALKTEFFRVCDSMKKYLSPQIRYQAEGLRPAPQIMVEASLCMDPLLKHNAENIAGIWSGDYSVIEDTMRTKFAIEDGPRFAPPITPPEPA